MIFMHEFLKKAKEEKRYKSSNKNRIGKPDFVVPKKINLIYVNICSMFSI